jgi:acetyl-CoA carboxylase biotin carboxyl carrier protein
LDLKQIKQVIDLMKRSELTEFEFEEEGFKIKIKRGNSGLPLVSTSQLSGHPFLASANPTDVGSSSQSTKIPTALPVAAGADEAGFAFVKSPMVGTFYRSPSPENPSFVEIGSKADEKTVVCIIEAMKIMNEIQAEIKGTIVEIFAENGQPVEYGQRLFKVKLA